MYDEFKTLLEQDKIEDMSRLYCLVKKTENHRNRADEESILDPMRKSFQDHIATQGQSYETKVGRFFPVVFRAWAERMI